jgi:dipeptidase E
MSKHIIAAGGDAMYDEALHLYILAQCEKRSPKICLLPTPSGDDKGVIKDFFYTFNRYTCDMDYLPLFHNKVENIEEFLLKQDVILVCGGHSKSALGVFKEWGLPEILKKAYDKGIILAGGSAGAVCWAKEAITDSFTGQLLPMEFMGFLPFSMCPHYVSEDRRKAYKSAILNDKIGPGYAINDGASIHFKDGEHYQSIATGKNASTFYVKRVEGPKGFLIESERLDTPWLGDKEVAERLVWDTPHFRDLLPATSF